MLTCHVLPFELIDERSYSSDVAADYGVPRRRKGGTKIHMSDQQPAKLSDAELEQHARRSAGRGGAAGTSSAQTDRASDGDDDEGGAPSSERVAPPEGRARSQSVPGAHAVDGPGAETTRNRNNRSGDDDDDDEGSVCSAVREVRTFLRHYHTEAAGANARSFREMSNHPDIEYLAEATLVEAAEEEEEEEGGDDDGGGDGDSDVLGDSRGSTLSSRTGRHHNNSGALRASPHVEGEQEGGHPTSSSGREDDVSTLGPPPELRQPDPRLSQMQRRGSNGSNGTNLTAADTVHGSTVVTAKRMDNVCGFMSRRSFFVSISVFVILLLVVGLAVGLTKGTDPTTDEQVLFPDPDEVLTTVPEPVCFSYLPKMSNLSKACPDPTSLPRGGPLCQLVAEGLLEAADPAANIDIAITNAGAIRSDALAGDLTVGTVRTQVLPFSEDRAAYLSVTPAEIKATLEAPLVDDGLIFTEAMQKEFFPDVPTVKLHWSYEAKYPYAAGLRYDVDIAAPDGEKVSNIVINPRYAGDDDWIALDVTDTTTLIRVVTSDYLAGGGDGYFTGVPRERIEIQENLELADLFLSYCSRQKELIGPDRIVDMSTREFLTATTDD